MRIEAAIKLKVTVATAHVGVTSSVLLSSSAIFSLSITRVFFWVSGSFDPHFYME